MVPNCEITVQTKQFIEHITKKEQCKHIKVDTVPLVKGGQMAACLETARSVVLVKAL